MAEQLKANSLIHETSPYLQQHAYNPVNWYPWNDEALALARHENKPILLSIGYSACHWCHVMAHESFEDRQTAELMNRYFINIKIDREERPDLDRIYQTAQYILTRRSGGWPLTMFLTPGDHVPFFGGTYFPPVARHGLPGFRELLSRVAEFYQQEQESIQRQNAAVVVALQQTQESEGRKLADAMDASPIMECITELSQSYDEHNGGFGGAPKFPVPVTIVRLLHHTELGLDSGPAQQMALHTLRQMATGGIYDQIGGGFCRYSVDQWWMIPHFEKMLYDNGQLLALYADAWQISRDDLFARITSETADWLIREMQSPDGGFYSSLDADSEGIEGKYYVWTPDAARSVLAAEEFDIASRHYGLDQAPNFEHNWHLYISVPLNRVAADCSLDSATAAKLLDSARRKLHAARENRIRPGCDDKILTSWNALAISGLATAAIRLQRDDYRQSAEAALAFIHEHLWTGERLHVTWKDGKSRLNAYLDDYAYLLDAVLILLQAGWSGKWLDFAMQLADTVIDNFYDVENHGFYFTSHDHETLIQRRKDYMDDATPAGNGVVARSLALLGHLVNEYRYTEIAENTLKSAYGVMTRAPSACNSLLLALEDYLYPPTQIILRGNLEAVNDWKKTCLGLIPARTRVYAIPVDAGKVPDFISQLPPAGDACAYICEGFQCREPIMDKAALINYLQSPA